LPIRITTTIPLFPYTTLFRSKKTIGNEPIPTCAPCVTEKPPARENFSVMSDELILSSASPPYSSGTSAPKRPSSPAFFSKSTERSEEHTSELQSRFDLVCRLL